MKKPEIISIVNQKGGVGKTTSAINIASILAYNGQKVLLIDSDPQSNSTSFYFPKKDFSNTYTFYHFIKSQLNTKPGKELRKSLSFKYFIKTKKIEVEDKTGLSIDVLPSTDNLIEIEPLLFQENDKDLKLKNAIKYYEEDINRYDFIIIDSPPSISLFTVNAFMASKYLLVPIQADDWSNDGLLKMFDRLGELNTIYSADVELLGVFFTGFQKTHKEDREKIEKLSNTLKGRLFKTTIRRSATVVQSNNKNKSLLEYNVNSKVFSDYYEITKELLERLYEKA